MSKRDYYEVLGVAKTGTDEEIKKALRSDHEISSRSQSRR